jgi:menaquinone-dependent protoporphyrinogen oxidase
MRKILVTYASKHQSTAEIACAIGELLQQTQDFQVDIRSVGAVETLGAYDVVILGSAVYMGQWHPEAASFLKRHERELAHRPVWLFSSGPTGQGDPAMLLKGWEFPEALQAVAMRIKPRNIALFHGRLEPSELNFLEQSAIRLVHAETGDFRDWTTIRAWAESIAQALQNESNEHSYDPNRKEISC